MIYKDITVLSTKIKPNSILKICVPSTYSQIEVDDLLGAIQAKINEMNITNVLIYISPEDSRFNIVNMTLQEARDLYIKLGNYINKLGGESSNPKSNRFTRIGV